MLLIVNQVKRFVVAGLSKSRHEHKKAYGSGCHASRGPESRSGCSKADVLHSAITEADGLQHGAKNDVHEAGTVCDIMRRDVIDGTGHVRIAGIEGLVPVVADTLIRNQMLHRTELDGCPHAVFMAFVARRRISSR
jgi:hypothetical protein